MHWRSHVVEGGLVSNGVVCGDQDDITICGENRVVEGKGGNLPDKKPAQEVRAYHASALCASVCVTL